jgi:hypothetical protein
MASSFVYPRISASIAICVACFTLLSKSNDSLFRSLALVPGNNILGEMNVWSLWTSNLVEKNIIRVSFDYFSYFCECIL